LAHKHRMETGLECGCVAWGDLDGEGVHFCGMHGRAKQMADLLTAIDASLAGAACLLPGVGRRISAVITVERDGEL
jgi:hypothetical protein